MVKSKSKRFKSAHSAAEPLVVALPKEMWIRIWDYLDYETLQKKCTRVSRKWFEDIRNSARLSGKLTLKTRTRSKKIDDLSAKGGFFSEKPMHSSFLQTDEPNYFPEVEC